METVARIEGWVLREETADLLGFAGGTIVGFPFGPVGILLGAFIGVQLVHRVGKHQDHPCG